LGNVTAPPELAGSHLVEMTGALRELTALLSRAVDLVQALDDLAAAALRAVPDADRCGLIILRDGQAALVRAAGRDATGAAVPLCGPAPAGGLDQAQCRVGDGPGLAAIRGRELVAAPDLFADPRWPDWTAAALAAGLRSVVALPLEVAPAVTGALCLYAEKPDALDDGAQLAALLLAEHAALLLGTVLERADRDRRTAELSAALHGDSPVAHAVGIVMAQRGCGADAALAVLTGAATRAGITLEEVAGRLVAAVARRGD
jgi:GAF domain-containing protein